MTEPVRQIGGSDAAPACGVEVYGKNRITLWEELTGRRMRSNVDSRPIRRGNSLEDWIGSEYAHETGKAVRRRRKAYTSRKYPWMRAHIDRRITGERVVLECKSVHPMALLRGDTWGEAGSDDVPMHYLLQCVHYNVVTDAERTDVAAMFGDELRIYRVERNAELEARVIEREREVWEHAIADRAPEPMTAAEVLSLYPGDDASAIVADPRVVMACERLASLKRELAGLEGEKDELEELIKVFIAECAILLDEKGTQLATWKQAKGSTKVDWRGAFLAMTQWVATRGDFDDLAVAVEAAAFSQFFNTANVPGSRRFLLKTRA